MIQVRPNLRRALVSVVLALSAACATFNPPSPLQRQAEQEWEPTLTRARSIAGAGQTSQADSLLARYAAQYPAAPQSNEVNYWRALLNLRSTGANQRLSVTIPLLQVYVAAGQRTEHWMEADALLRAVTRMDTLTRVAAAYVSRGDGSTDAAAAANARAADAKAEAKAATADTKAQDEEIRHLKDELAKSKDELDRIKKRLAEPPKKPPYS